MDTTENLVNFELDFNKNSVKQSISALVLKIRALVKLPFKKKESNVFENRLRIMNESTTVLNNLSINLRGDMNIARHTRFKECLNDMPALQRAAFHMKTFDNYKTAFICEDLEITEDLFWSLISKSRKELIKALEL